MNGSAGGMSPALISLAVGLVVIVRFLFRELRERTVKVRTLWIRPGIIALLTVGFAVAAFARPSVNPGLFVLMLLAGAAVGVLTGVLVLGSTTFAPAGIAGAVRVRGSVVTVIVWIAALSLRLAARFVVGGAGADLTTQYELNAGLLALLAGAFIVVALGFHRAIDRLAPDATVARTL
jgi:hypothetical protein